MSFEILKYKTEHLDLLTEQEAMAYLRVYFTPQVYKLFEDSPHSFTAAFENRIVGCAGVVEEWPGRGTCWAILDQDCKNCFLNIHHAVKRFLEICPIKRIEAAVQADFRAGHRWVKSLGFSLEAPLMKSYLPGGADASLYAKVRSH